jgi:type II restriction enzyme
MELTAETIYRKLVDEYNIIGETGNIKFTVKDLSILIRTKDSVGNLLQEWLKAWLFTNRIFFEENTNSQSFPDFLLKKDDYTTGLLEVKSFDFKRGPVFDLANFDSYCNSLLTHAYRLDSDYLILAYEMNDGIISIKNVWLKKIWELACPSSTYPLKVQEKKNVIYNIRPSIWYSNRATFKPFNSKEAFLSALNNTRYQYPQTRPTNAHWLNKVLKNYQEHTGILLTVA